MARPRPYSHSCASINAAARSTGCSRSSSHHAVVVGLLIAFGEIAVGVGTLLGLWTRVAGRGRHGARSVLSVVRSWHTHPYYLGPDIVFLFAFIPLLLAGAGDVWALDGWLRREGRVALGLPPAGVVNIEFATVRRVCGQYDSGRCRAQQGRPCQPEGCPVLLAAPAREDEARAVDLDRRVFLAQARLAGALGAVALIGGGITVGIGRLLKGSTPSTSTPRARYQRVQPSHDPVAPLDLDHDVWPLDDWPRCESAKWHGRGCGCVGCGPRCRVVHRSCHRHTGDRRAGHARTLQGVQRSLHSCRLHG